MGSGEAYTQFAMPHPIRYARTTDHVNIAFTEVGAGEPTIYLPTFPWCNVSAVFADPLLAVHAEQLGSALQLLVYDARGCGLSDHDPADLSLDGLVRDIDAVADAAGVDRFALYGSGEGARIMIRYAATRPERVTKLILWLPSVSNRRLHEDQVVSSTRTLASQNWDLYLNTCSFGVVGGWDADRAAFAASWANLMRAAVREEDFPRLSEALHDHDVAADLARVTAPTTVIARESASVYTLEVAREVAAGIAGSRLVVAPGNWLLPCTDHVVTEAILQFVTGQESTPTNDLDANEAAQKQVPEWDNPNGRRLSTRECEVLSLISQGKTNAEIAELLGVTLATSSRHVHNILTKLGVNRRTEAAVFAATRLP